jgi:hypothetical protein
VIEGIAATFVLAFALVIARAQKRWAALLIVIPAAVWAWQRPPAVQAPFGPTTTIDYVTSAACLPCHSGQHASFSRTYHATMTRAATPDAIAAPMDGLLERRGTEVWAPREGKRVVLVTGSHREQAYWLADARGGAADATLLPYVWMIGDRRFVPRSEAFLLPPGAPLPDVRWATSCIACHAVAGEPRRAALDTRVSELGIACEACHGPGRAHVDKHRDPIARYAQHERADPTILHPARLSAERSAALCGQCHAYAYPRDEFEWWSHGYTRTFRPGHPLEPSRTLATPADPLVDLPVDALFWPNGAIRVGGREHNGLVASACYERGTGERKLTCISCHAMHESDPAGQIAPARAGDRACTTCHAKDDHAHHAAALCVDCHMPKTSFALLSAVRSHRIDVPRAEAPNACNLCHLDRSLRWTAERLMEWFRRSPPARAPFDDVPFAIAQAGAGDAAMRAIVADALRTSAFAGTVRAAVSSTLARDPYAAVRFIAERAHLSTSGPPIDPAIVAARDLRPITIAE